jgi:hypothetical protein
MGALPGVEEVVGALPGLEGVVGALPGLEGVLPARGGGGVLSALCGEFSKRELEDRFWQEWIREIQDWCGFLLCRKSREGVEVLKTRTFDLVEIGSGGEQRKYWGLKFLNLTF